MISIRDITPQNKGIQIRLRREDEFGRAAYPMLNLLTAAEARGWAKCLLAAADQVEAAERDALCSRRSELEQLQDELIRQMQAIDAQLCETGHRDRIEQLIRIIPVHEPADRIADPIDRRAAE